MTEWQPIETAPKDGTNLLLFFPNLRANSGDEGIMRKDMAAQPDSEIVVGYCDANGDWISDFGYAEYWGYDAGDYSVSPIIAIPTHWMPLPEPPNASDDTGQPTVDRLAELEAALRLMLTHGERCNWFADRGDEEVCDKARAALDAASPLTTPTPDQGAIFDVEYQPSLEGDVAAAICGHPLLHFANVDALDEFHGFVQQQLLRLIEASVTEFVKQILHGDAQHRDWLIQAGQEFIAGRPIRGQGVKA